MFLSPEQYVFAEKLRTSDDDSSTTAPTNSMQWSVISIFLFLLFMGVTSGDLRWVIAITITIVIHELGHFVGMKMFGYKDVRMFLVPFFGGLATGEKHAPSAFEQAIVLLLGPLPGLVLALILTFTTRSEFVIHAVDEQLPWLEQLLLEFRSALGFINALNLIPLAPLDGGRLVQLLVIGRNAWLMLVFVAISSIVLILFSLLIKAWLLALFAVFGLIGLLVSARRILVASNVRKRLAGMSKNLRELTNRDCRTLHFLARKIDPTADPNLRVSIARSLHEEIVAKPLSWGQAATVVLLYFAGWIIWLVVSSVPFKVTFEHPPQAK